MVHVIKHALCTEHIADRYAVDRLDGLLKGNPTDSITIIYMQEYIMNTGDLEVEGGGGDDGRG